jgi:hypothetical protein
MMFESRFFNISLCLLWFACSKDVMQVSFLSYGIASVEFTHLLYILEQNVVNGNRPLFLSKFYIKGINQS